MASRRLQWVVAVAVFAAATAALAADPAQDYPNRPVRLITGSPGSTSDYSARFIAQKLSDLWHQQVVVDNRPGAGGIIGAEIAAQANADGYTLLVGQIGTHASPQFLFRKLGYDPVRDFAPITLLTDSGIALVVHAAVPVSDLREFVAYAQAKPGSVNYGSPGGGTSGQLSGELFNQMTGAKLVHIPYKGAGFALSGVVAGEVQAAFLATTTASVQVKSGKLKALAVLSKERFPAAPEIPTAAEQGFPGIDASVWFGLFAPARTPKSIIAKINRDAVAALQSPEARRVLEARGAVPMPTTPEAFRAFLDSEIAKWGKVIREARIAVN
ncbi:MAG: Bug family tripartite tricarboxylate transporter substrate binding protein [Burkholderiales bacterium]